MRLYIASSFINKATVYEHYWMIYSKLHFETRLCTRIIYLQDSSNDVGLELKERLLDTNYKPTQKEFNPNFDMEKEDVLGILEQMQTEEKKDVEKKMEAKRHFSGKRRLRTMKILGRKEEINQKRRLISEIIIRTGLSTIKSIATATSCHVSTVKSTIAQLKMRGRLIDYQYNNEHSVSVHEQINNYISDPRNKYFSASDIKRRVPSCSKKFIRKKLKQAGFKYLKLKRNRMNFEYRNFDKKELKSVIWTVVQAIAKNKETILFLDEVEFPLLSVSSHCWSKLGGSVSDATRLSANSLYVIALCSQERFLAVQIFAENVNQEGVYYFLTEVLKKFESIERLIILLDNAGWHLANLIKKSVLNRLLLFNVPRCWETNLIENTFSKLKSLWRRRSLTDSLQEEIDILVSIFLKGTTKEDFDGYRRQYLRQVALLAETLS